MEKIGKAMQSHASARKVLGLALFLEETTAFSSTYTSNTHHQCIRLSWRLSLPALLLWLQGVGPVWSQGNRAWFWVRGVGILMKKLHALVRPLETRQVRATCHGTVGYLRCLALLYGAAVTVL